MAEKLNASTTTRKAEKFNSFKEMMIMKQFEGKVAIVTGAASGIGQKCAQFFVRDGANYESKKQA